MRACTGTAHSIVAAGVRAAIAEVRNESLRDTIRALQGLADHERRALRAVAAGNYTVAQLDDIAQGETV